MAVTRSYSNDQLTHFALRDGAVTEAPISNVCGGPCTVYSMEIHNSGTGGLRYFKIWDHLEPEVGVTIPDFVFEVANDFKHIVTFPEGIPFATGLSYACTLTGADNNTGAPGATILISMVAKVG